MNDMFKRLEEIESAAASILEQANAKKKEMSDAMNLKMAQFDKETEIATQKTIAQLKETLQQQSAAELAQQRADMEKLLAKLEQEYDEKHTELANQILAKLTKE